MYQGCVPRVCTKGVTSRIHYSLDGLQSREHLLHIGRSSSHGYDMRPE
eukprot:gene26446-biopygen16490